MSRTHLPIIGILVLLIGGCARLSVGRATTTSQELNDLDQARSAGAVSEAEYSAIRADLSGGKRP